MKAVLFARDLVRLAEPGMGRVTALLTLTLAGEILLVPQPFLLAWFLGRLAGETIWWDLATFGGLVLLLNLAYGGISLLRVRIGRQLSLAAANRLRSRFFRHVLHLPYAFFLEHQAGGQANAYLNDIDDVDLAVGGLIESGLRSTFSILVGAIALAWWNPLFALISCCALPLTVFAQRWLRETVRHRSRRKTDLREDMSGTLSEAIQNAPVLKSFVLEPLILDRLDRQSRHFATNDVRLETTQSALRSSASVVLIFTQYAFFVIGGWMVIAGSLALPHFLGQLVLVNGLVGPLNNLLQYINQLTQGQAGLHRVHQTLDREQEGAGHAHDRRDLPAVRGGSALQIDDLHFRYRDDSPLLEGLDLHLAPGETIAIVGPSGSGKTTIFQLLLGLFEDYQGRITLDGVDLHDLDLEELRRRVGVVFQEHVLFNATIRENLAVALDSDPADDAPYWQALQMAHADDFVRALPEGLDTRIGMGGIRLSGGQRQRLAIARVILRNPPLLLLDEATSALDSFSEAHIQAALDELFVGRSSIVIAHRLSTITNADRILVLDHGRVVESGTHQQLIEQGGIYADLVQAQVEGFLSWGDDDPAEEA